MAWKTFPIKVVEIGMVTPSVLVLTFARADGERLEYAAGQFINIHFEHEGTPIHRSYSVANTPGSDSFQIAISPVEGGRATKLLFGLKIGDVIEGSGPYGRFVLRDDQPCRYIMAATGTGVTPYRAMLPLLEQRIEQGFKIDILLGVWR
ncbi:MAG: ferredoxin--NADP reductase, partial [Gammaproteobacteria bacterium]|nr:ferredoxin--NADP reductase [Gammaproteobacteria bacterium]